MINNMKHELTNRPRRLRTSPVLRSMVRETRISTDTLVYPFFVVEGENIKEEIKKDIYQETEQPLRSLPKTLVREIDFNERRELALEKLRNYPA